jgi:hypothetical protein
MGRRIEPPRRQRRPWALALTFLVVALAACGSTPGPVGSTGPAGGPLDSQAAASTSGAVPGGWRGTITFHAVLNTVKDDTSTSGEGVYAETTTTHDVTQADVTDAFAVSGQDPADLEYGIGSVDLTGTVANQGSTLERYVFLTDKHNALGCHWTDETGTEVSGSWGGNSSGAGSISFSDDGSYRINIDVGGDPTTGAAPPSPELPKRLWQKNTILEGAAKDCPGPGTEQTTTEGPIVEWASSVLGPYDSIKGTLDAASPGAVVDGSKTFDETSPKATLTVTWHLVHEGSIVLPHS